MLPGALLPAQSRLRICWRFFCVVLPPLQRERGFMSVFSAIWRHAKRDVLHATTWKCVYVCVQVLSLGFGRRRIFKFLHTSWLAVPLRPAAPSARRVLRTLRWDAVPAVGGLQAVRTFGEIKLPCVYKHTRRALGLTTTLRLQGTKRSVSARSAAGLSCWSPNARTEPCGQNRDYWYCWSRCW